jgi:hypothetical protein
MIFWCIVPLTRIQNCEFIIEQFVLQNLDNKKLIFVQDNIVSTSIVNNIINIGSGTTGISEALNAGLYFARENGSFDDWFVKWDDDDFYGPSYLQSIKIAQQIGANMTGRSKLWMKTSDQKIWFINGSVGWSNSCNLHGSTLAASLDCCDFTHVDRCGEDTIWVQNMRQKGAKIWACEPKDHCYIRSGNNDHAWPIPDFAIQPITGWEMYDCGTNNDYLIKTNNKPNWAKKHNGTINVKIIDEIFNNFVNRE